MRGGGTSGDSLSAGGQPVKRRHWRQPGGFSEDADRNYVNLAAKIKDGEQIYFPTLAEGLVSERLVSEAEKTVPGAAGGKGRRGLLST